MALLAPLTSSMEGTKYRAYKDSGGQPTICNGHTKNVHIGMTATNDQCQQFLHDDLMDHTTMVLVVTPNLIQNQHALMAASDFTFNAGLGAWKKSPMASYFDRMDWAGGCQAFQHYYTGVTLAKPKSNLMWQPSVHKPGKWVCELPGLVTRRLKESHLCFTGSL
jgi:lysozyme